MTNNNNKHTIKHIKSHLNPLTKYTIKNKINKKSIKHKQMQLKIKNKINK